MSLNAEIRQVDYPDAVHAVFFDDFFGDLYDNQTWGVTGTGSAIMQDTDGGFLRIRATAGNMYEFNMGNIGNFAVANNFVCEWRGKLRPGTSVSAECGLEGAGDQSNNWICWQRANGTANFLCQTGAPSGTTTTDSGVAADNNNHLFKIVGSPGIIQFFLDDVLITTILANITASALQPYVWNSAGGGSGASDAFMDYVLVTGDRA
jgi:hypothetical protein